MGEQPNKTPAKPRGRPFQKGGGDPRSGGGRPPGVQNKVTREIKEIAQGLLEDPIYQAKLKEQLQEGKLAPPVLCLLYNYAYGKPKETVDVTADVAYRWLNS